MIDTGDGRLEIPLDEGSLRFSKDMDGRGDGVAGFGVEVRDADAVIAAAQARGLPTGHDHFIACGVRIGLREI